MKARIALRLSTLVLFLLGMTVGPRQSHAQTADTLATEASSMDTLAVSQGEAKVIDKLSGEFSSFLGDDAKTVITGLRNGTPITLTTTAPSTTPGGMPVTTTTTINPPTGKMGFGNVFISLALAKQQLNLLGIDQPTSDQLSAALLGGSITTGSGTTATTTQIQGILTMRSQDMGWGQIAQELGFKLGSVVSSLKTAHQGIVETTSPTGSGIANGGGQPLGSAESRVVTGSGKSVGKSTKGVLGKSGKGIVSGSGRPVGSPSNVGVHGRGAIVTGSGRPVGSSSGITTGLGHSSGVSGRGAGGAGRGRGHKK